MTAGSTVGAVANTVSGAWYAASLSFSAAVPVGPGSPYGSPESATFSPFYGAADGTGVRTGTGAAGISIDSPATTPGDGTTGSSPSTVLTPHYLFGDNPPPTVVMVPEIWTPGRSQVSSSAATTAYQGAVEFKIMPDTEHTMSALSLIHI